METAGGHWSSPFKGVRIGLWIDQTRLQVEREVELRDQIHQAKYVSIDSKLFLDTSFNSLNNIANCNIRLSSMGSAYFHVPLNLPLF